MASNRSHGVCAPQPAHHTKHLAELAYTFKQCTFRLAQLNNGNTNGTALWMGAQVLSAWLAHTLDNKNRVKHAAGRRPRVLELGSGIGLSAYVFLFPSPSMPCGADGVVAVLPRTARSETLPV